MRKTVLSIAALVISFYALSQGVDNENLRVSHGPWIQNLSTNAVTVMWVSNKPAVPAVTITDDKGVVRYVRNSTDGIINGGGELHKIRINGLEPGKQYTYRLESIELVRYQPYKIYYGDTLKSKEFKFITLNPDAKEVRAIVLNDIHEKSFLINDYLEESDLKPTDIVFGNGDIINHLQDLDQIYKGFLDSSVDMFASEIPFYLVRGNHETRGILARDFKNFFDFPDDRFYYAFTNGPVHFLALDCGEDKPDENRYYFGLADYDSYRLKELAWLKDHIKTPEFKKAKYRVVIVHMPIIEGKDMGHGMQFLSDYFGPVLKDAGIDLMVSGHTHRNKYHSEDESGFGYPVLVSSNKTFIEVWANGDKMIATLKDAKGEIVIKKEFD